MQSLIQDLRYGARMLLKKPGFTLIAVITLALGIGANTAIFTVVNAALLRPLSYPEPERIMRLAPDWSNVSFRSASEPKFVFWSGQSQSFDGVAATIGIGSGVNLSGGNEPEFVSGVRVSADFFRVLGAHPAIGRDFTKEEDSPSGEEGHNYTVLARIKPGVSQAQALADMRVVFDRFKDAYPKMLWRQEEGI